MFSVRQKREIADAVQKILRDTKHPELSTGEIEFALHVAGAEGWSWAVIQNNGAVPVPSVNPHNELMAIGMGAMKDALSLPPRKDEDEQDMPELQSRPNSQGRREEN